MKITGADEIVEEGLTLETGTFLYNRDRSAGLKVTTRGFAVSGLLMGAAAYAVLADANATLSAAQHRGGIVSVAAGANNRTLTTLTAALLVAAFPGAIVGTSVPLKVVNLKITANTVTVAGGTGVSLVGHGVVGQNVSGSFVLLFTNVTSGAEAVQLIRVA
jgi:hypothetical protein